jgi:hypothetical protein
LVTQIRFSDGGTSLGIKGKDAQRDECKCACKERRYDRTPLTFGLEHFATASLHRHRLHPCTKAATELHFEGSNHIACLLDGQVVAEARDHDACSIVHAGLSGCPLEMVSRCRPSFTVGCWVLLSLLVHVNRFLIQNGVPGPQPWATPGE